jgi:hypothetical protein
MIYSNKTLLKYMITTINKIYFERTNDKHYIHYNVDLLCYTIGA